MSTSAFSLGTRILGAGAAVLVLFLAVGFALPKTWSAERTAHLEAPPEAVFPLVDAPAGWRLWIQWPESGIQAQGPERGVGARLVWDDDELGDGSFEITEVVPSRRVGYAVRVQGGSMQTSGTLELTPDGEGTRVTWHEEGDFGWNPLMGYWARLMERAQGRELEKALDRLGAQALQGGNATAPVGHQPTGAEVVPDTTGEEDG